MKPGIPWSVKGIEPEMREAAKDAARRSGMTLGEWLNSMISEQADDRPVGVPSVRMSRPQRAENTREENTIRLEDIAEQLARIARREQDTAPGRNAYTNPNRDADNDTLARILNRVESNERQTVEAFSAVNERLTVVGRQIAQVNKMPTFARADETPGYQALEKAMRNIVEHLEVSERRTRDNLKSMQDRMGEMSTRAATAPNDAVLQSVPAFNLLEQRLSDLTNRLERTESKSNQGLPEAIRHELSSLADRIEIVREASEDLASRAQTEAVQTSQQELRAIEQRIVNLLHEAQTSINNQNATPAEIQRIRSEIESLNQRIDGASQGVASDRDVHALRVAVEQLSTRVAQGPDMRPLADMDAKLVDISQRLELTQASTRNMPQFGELERRMVELDHRLNEAMRLQGDGQAQIALEQKITEVSDRMERAEHQLGHLETIERAINQLFDSIEQQRTTAKTVAEEAAEQAVGRITQNFMSSQQPAVSFDQTPEYHALQDGLRVVRESANQSDQRNQETLEAVHETLEQIVLKLGELETAAVGHQVATAIQQPIAYAETPAPQDWQVQPEPRQVADENYSQDHNPFTNVEPSFAEPLPELGNNPFAEPVVSSAAPQIQAAPLPPPVMGDDFIAAARRAAQAASNSKSVLSAVAPATTRGAEASVKSLWQKLPFPRRSPKPSALMAGEKLMPEIQPAAADSGKRRKLLLMGLVLLAAVSAFTVNMMSGPAAKAPVAPVAIESTVQPELAPAQVPAETPAAQAGEAQPPQPKPAEIEGNLTPPAVGNVSETEITAEDDILTGSLENPPSNASVEALVSGAATEMAPAALGTLSLRQAAANGDTAAQFVIGTRYLDGDGVPQDYAQAAKWYGRAAAAGSAPSQYRLATLFERGKGVAQNNAEAFKWYEQAGAQGNVKAMHNAAVIATGTALGKPDYNKALAWFTKAAEHGLKDSQYNLAVLLERGLGGKPDMEKALFWYMQAAIQGDADAAKRADAMSVSLSPSKVDAAKILVKNWSAQKAFNPANVVAVSDADWQADGRKTTSKLAPVGDNMISQTQNLLTALGFNIGEPDGQMGSKTANAIRLFQLQSGMKVTGQASSELITALQAKTS
jgi:localization factor PodJL